MGHFSPDLPEKSDGAPPPLPSSRHLRKTFLGGCIFIFLILLPAGVSWKLGTLDEIRRRRPFFLELRFTKKYKHFLVARVRFEVARPCFFIRSKKKSKKKRFFFCIRPQINERCSQEMETRVYAKCGKNGRRRKENAVQRGDRATVPRFLRHFYRHLLPVGSWWIRAEMARGGRRFSKRIVGPSAPTLAAQSIRLD